MQGSFEIVCRRQPDGATAIGRQVISAPWHLSKPYWDGKTLIIQAVNATAGIFAGDHLALNVKVESGASVLLTSPSASRIHTMPEGEASLTQELHVATDAWLEWMPELFIPQKDCRYRQTTEIHIEKGGGLYAVETLAPGRVASGESFAFDKLIWSTRVRRAGKLLLAERYPLTPRNNSLHDLVSHHPRYFANALLIHPDEMPLREWQNVLTEWKSDSASIGGTQLDTGAYLFRILSDTSEQLKDTLRRLRLLLSDAISILRQSARKL